MRILIGVSLFLVILAMNCFGAESEYKGSGPHESTARILLLEPFGNTDFYLDAFSFSNNIKSALDKIRQQKGIEVDYEKFTNVKNVNKIKSLFKKKEIFELEKYNRQYDYVIGLRVIGTSSVATIVYDNNKGEYFNKEIGYTSYFLTVDQYELFYKNISAGVKSFIEPYLSHSDYLASGKNDRVDNSVVNSAKTKNVNRYAIAVIVGSKNYSINNKDVPDVDYALNDAQKMYRYVVDVLGYREGNIIYLKDPTQSDLIGTFGSAQDPKGKLFDWVKPGESDVFVYYSGHGAPSLADGQGYLLPVNADPQRVELTGYPLDVLYKNLSQIPAREMAVVIDACFSGSSDSGTIVKNASSITLKYSGAKQFKPGGAVLTAASASEVASWDASSQQGLFTRCFLDGVYGGADKKPFGNEDGKVTLSELKGFLEDEVTYRARRDYGREQHPQISGPTAVLFSEFN